MSFSLTSRNISLNGAVLSAECQRRDGNWVWSAINTDLRLGNINGDFQWAGVNWTLSARNTSFNSPVITSDLQRADLSWAIGKTINLDNHIANVDGTLV